MAWNPGMFCFTMGRIHRNVAGNKGEERPMPVIAVMYPSADGATFDEAYYTQTHIPLVRQRWEQLGLTNVALMRGVPGPDGAGPVYTMVALLTFATMNQFKAAATQHGREIFADIPNFTSASPVIQFNEPVG
jgi:uncharacterized protein (TIGR02118 family)